MSDTKIIGLIGGAVFLVLAVAIPFVLINSKNSVPPASISVPSESPPPPRGTAPTVQRSRDATQEERDTLSKAAKTIETRAPQLFEESNLSEADRRRIYLASFQAIDAAEARGQNDYDYRPEIAQRFGITVKQVNSIAMEGARLQWPDR